MKLTVFSDIHGSVSGMECVLEIINREQPDKVVICGDLFGGWISSPREIAEAVSRIDAVTYLVRGNNDRDSEISLLPYGMEDYAVMYHFGRTLFFTHGHVYNKYRIPPVLRQKDVLVYGHTHCSLLQRFNGLYIVNVGSVSRPRDGKACYLTMDETGVTLKGLNGEVLDVLPWANA